LLQRAFLELHARSTVVLPIGGASNFYGEHAHVLAELGMFPEATANGEESVRLAQAGGFAPARAGSLFYLGTVYTDRGLVTEAIAALEQSVEWCEIAGHRGLFPGAATRLVWAYTLAGRAEEAVPLAELAVERAAAIGRTGERSMRALALGGAYLGVSRWHDALDLANKALALATASGERGYEARALQLLGEVAVRADPPNTDEATSQFRQALSLAEELEMRPLQAHCHLGLGKLYRRIGRAEDARVELATAMAMLREMGMTFWLPDAEAELVQLDIGRQA
jgi:tetratricopeptide (TPR) repeat protein